MKHHLHLTMWLVPVGILLYSGGLYSLIVFGLTLLMVLGLWYKKRRESHAQVIVPEILTPEDQYLYMVTKVRKMRGEHIRNYYTIKVNRLWNFIRVITIILLATSCKSRYVTTFTHDSTTCSKEWVRYRIEKSEGSLTLLYSNRRYRIRELFIQEDRYNYRSGRWLLTLPGYEETHLIFALQDSTHVMVIGYKCYAP